MNDKRLNNNGETVERGIENETEASQIKILVAQSDKVQRNSAARASDIKAFWL